MSDDTPIILQINPTETQSSSNSSDNRLWIKIIPGTNRVFLILSLLLVFGLDLIILISSPSLFPFWAMMLANLVASLTFFYFENFLFYKKYAHTKSKLDLYILILIIIRNLVFILNYIPLIQLLGLAIWTGFSIPYLLAYCLILWFRSKKS
jgi:hypothetical protein